MAKKDGMYFYSDWLKPFEKLEKSEVGELVIAMMKYFIDGEEPPVFEGLLGMAQDFIFPQIDRSMEYARLGSKGGNATKEKTVKKKEIPEKKPEPEEYFFEKEEEKEEIKEEKKEPYKEKEAEVKYESPEQRLFRKMQMEDYFTRFWREYPKKAGKSKAFEVFQKLSPDRDLVDKMVDAVNRLKKTENWKKEDGRYIPLPENWLEKRRWEDEIEEPKSTSKYDDPDAYYDEFFNEALMRTEDLYREIDEEER